MTTKISRFPLKRQQSFYLYMPTGGTFRGGIILVNNWPNVCIEAETNAPMVRRNFLSFAVNEPMLHAPGTRLVYIGHYVSHGGSCVWNVYEEVPY